MIGAVATIDANILSAPPIEASRSATHRYVDRILNWSKLLEEPWIALCMSERASEALFEDEFFPMRDQLEGLFSSQGVIEYDVNTVCAVVNKLLQHTPSFESCYRVRDVLWEGLTSSPDVMRFCTGKGLQADLARCMLLLAVVRTHCHDGVLQNSLILKQCPSRRIEVRALVHELEHSRDDLGDAIPTPPEHFGGCVLACDNFDGLLDCIDEGAILQGAQESEAIGLAIRIRRYKSRIDQGLEPDWDEIEDVAVGDRFLSAVVRCGRGADPAFPAKALRAMCEAIERQSLQAVHALRTGAGGNDPQRVRTKDEAKAWRRDIDHEYHLHYWELPDGSIELASVGVHNDFTIPE